MKSKKGCGQSTRKKSVGMASYELQVNRADIERMERVDRLTTHGIRVVADLSKYGISLIDETMFKTDRELKWHYMSKEEEEYHKRLAESYAKCIRDIVDRYSYAITNKVSVACSTSFYYHALEDITSLYNEAQEEVKPINRQYWCLIYRWTRGGGGDCT